MDSYSELLTPQRCSTEEVKDISQVGEGRKFEALQGARGIAALLIVLCHTTAFIGLEPTLWHRYGIYLWGRGTVLGVQLFFVLSGIVIFRAHHADLNQPATAPAFYWKRFRRIYPLYWVFFALTVLKHNSSTIDSSGNYQHDPWVILSGLFLVHLFSYQTNMVVAWTLFDEVQFYFVFSALLLNRKIGTVIFCLWIGASLCLLGHSDPYWSTFFSPYHLLFGLGILVAKMLNTDRPLPAKQIFWSGIVVFGASVIVARPLDHGVAVRLTGGVGAGAILLGALILERQGKLTIPRWLVLLGDASYSIYLAHFMVISAVARFSYSHWHEAPIPIGFWMVILFFCGTTAGLATHFVIERPLLKALGRT